MKYDRHPVKETKVFELEKDSRIQQARNTLHINFGDVKRKRNLLNKHHFSIGSHFWDIIENFFSSHLDFYANVCS